MLLCHSMVPGFERTPSRVVVSFLDLTSLERQRDAAREKAEQPTRVSASKKAASVTLRRGRGEGAEAPREPSPRASPQS